MGQSYHVGEFVPLHVVVYHADVLGWEFARRRWCPELSSVAFAKLVEAYSQGEFSLASAILCGR